MDCRSYAPEHGESTDDSQLTPYAETSYVESCL